MATLDWVFAHTFFLGPILLYVTGCLCKFLQNQDRKWRSDNLFFATEILLSSLGAVLGSFVSMTGTVGAFDPIRVQTLFVFLVVDSLALAFVTAMHKAFEAIEDRPKLRLFMLAFVANLFAIFLFIATLYNIKLAGMI